MELGMEEDYLLWEFTEPILFESSRPPTPTDGPRNPNAVCAIEVAKRRSLKLREMAASGGVYTSQDRVFLVPGALLPSGLRPKPSDVVQDKDGDRWTVLEADVNRYGTTWRLTSRNLVLAEDLRDSIWIERASLSIDPAGVKVKAWPTGTGPRGGSTPYSDLPARVQLMTQEVADQRGIRGAKGSLAVIVGRQVVIDQETDRVRLRDGTYLDIVGIHDPQTIDKLPTLDCERRP